MSTGVDTIASITEQASKLLAQLERPREIESITTSVGEDQSGDTALFIHLHLKESADTDIRKLRDFSDLAQVHLMSNGITYFPYVYLEAA